MSIRIKASLLAVFSAAAGVFWTSQAYDLHAAVILYEEGNTVYGYIPYIYIGMFATLLAWAMWASILREGTNASSTEGEQ